MDDTDTFKGFAVAVALLMIPIALLCEWKRRKRDPDGLPFAWGYWQALTMASGLLIAMLALGGGAMRTDEGVALTGFAVVFGVLGLQMLRRNKWAWVIGTIMTFNPILWIINWLYLRKRL